MAFEGWFHTGALFVSLRAAKNLLICPARSIYQSTSGNWNISVAALAELGVTVRSHEHVAPDMEAPAPATDTTNSYLLCVFFFFDLLNI